MKNEQAFGKAGVLLINIGTPDAPTKKALRPYLKEFLSDPRVVDLPRWKWLPILYLIILNVRPKRSAAAYKKIWMEEGSPLIVYTERLVAAIQEELESRGLGHIMIDYAMRYGNPSIPSKLEAMKKAGVEHLMILPVYPQYSDATTASTFDGVAQALTAQRFIPEVRMIRNWHDDPAYIQALSDSVRAHYAEYGKPEKLLISFHGVPKRYLEEGDPYFCHCHKTARLMVENLGLAPDEYQMVFQSHFGAEEWLQPYADETIKALPSKGVKSVCVISPGFSLDCLETLEEMAMENRNVFLENGGERYEFIPCLNDSPAHVKLLSDLICRHGQGWDVFDLRKDGYEKAVLEGALALRREWETTHNIARLGVEDAKEAGVGAKEVANGDAGDAG